MATPTSLLSFAADTFSEQDAGTGNVNAGPDSSFDGDEAGAAGSNGGGYHISSGAIAAIIVVVCLVAIVGITTSVLFYIAKKREWTLKETLRRSAKKVVTVLTPRRSEFPRSVKDGGRSRSRTHNRLDDVPPTPRITPEQLEQIDLEKGVGKGGKKKVNLGRK